MALSGSLIIFQQPCEASLLSLLHTWSSRPGFKLSFVSSNRSELFVSFLPVFLPSHFKQMVRQYASLSQGIFMTGREDNILGIKTSFLPSFLVLFLPSFLLFLSFLLAKPRSSKERILCIPKFWDSWGGSKRRKQEVFLGLGREDVSSSSSWMAVLWG